MEACGHPGYGGEPSGQAPSFYENSLTEYPGRGFRPGLSALARGPAAVAGTAKGDRGMMETNPNIYIDPLLPQGFKMYGRYYKTCHMFTDGTEADLIAFGEYMGLKKCWIHRGSLVHYDLTAAKRAAAIAQGAIPVDRRFVYKFIMDRKRGGQ